MLHISDQLKDCNTDLPSRKLNDVPSPQDLTFLCHLSDFWRARSARRGTPRLGYYASKRYWKGWVDSGSKRIATSHQGPHQKNMVATQWAPSKKCKGGEVLKVRREYYPSLSEGIIYGWSIKEILDVKIQASPGQTSLNPEPMESPAPRTCCS